MSCKKLVTVMYSCGDDSMESQEIQLDHLLDLFVPLRISTLTAIKFANAQLTADDFQLICPLIPKSLRALDFSDLGLTSRCINALQKTLNRSKLAKLALANNPIGDESVWLLIDFIGKNTELKALDLRNCNITAQGIWPLLIAISQRPFDFLDLSDNGLGTHGVEYVRQFLALKPPLRSFAVNNAQMSEGDVIILVDLAAQHPNMRFSILGNPIIQYRELPPSIDVDMLPKPK